MARADSAFRILPEVVAMGPMIALDQGLGLWIETEDEASGDMMVSLGWDPQGEYALLSSLTAEKRQQWMEQLVQRLNRMVAEDMDGFSLALPELEPS